MREDTRTLRVENRGVGDAFFLFRGAPSAARSSGGAARVVAFGGALPDWLHVSPTRGVVPAGAAVDIALEVNKAVASALAADVGRAEVRVRRGPLLLLFHITQAT